MIDTAFLLEKNSEFQNVETNENLDDSFAEWDGDEIHQCPDLAYKFTLCNSTKSAIQFKIKLSETS